MLLAHRIQLDPNDVQATYFARAAGTARFAYNWALGEWSKQFAAWKSDNTLPKPSETALRRQLNSIKREQYPWMLEVTKNAPQMAIIQLGVAFKNFFAGCAGYPQVRKKGVDDRFTLSNDQFGVGGSRIRIPKLGWVRMRETLRFAGKIMSATVSRVAARWFVSITVDTQDMPPKTVTENQGTVGVDLGLSALATLSTGEKIDGPKAHKALLQRQRRLSKSLSRKHAAAKIRAGLKVNQPIPKGMRLSTSNNAKKTRAKLSRLHYRMANIRKDAMHKLTTDITRRFSVIGIEQLNVKGMMANRRLARSIADMSFFEFRRQLEYKAAMRGGIVVVADQWYPSSKTCSACAHRLDVLPLSVREWACPVCGAIHDRDINAAVNLRRVAESSAGDCQPFQQIADCSVTACGSVEGAGVVPSGNAKPSWAGS
jgi:putative transposase